MRTNLTYFVAAIVRRKLHIFAAAIALFPAIVWSQEYTVTSLGTLGGKSSYASAVNSSGHVAGESLAPGGVSLPFLYKNGAMINIGTTSILGPEGAFVEPVAIDNHDNVAINGVDHLGNSWALLWKNGQMSPLTPAGEFTSVTAMNASDTAVGFSGVSPDDYAGVILNGPQAGPIPQGSYAEIAPNGINNAGQIAAVCDSSFQYTGYAPTGPGCVVTGNTRQLLGLLPGFSFAIPFAIDSMGNTCGVSYSGDFSAFTATYWNGSTPANLGTTANATHSQCLALDDYFQGVGDAYSIPSKPFAVIFNPVTGAQDLNSLISQHFRKGQAVRIVSAASISDSGYIAANCLIGGQARACLLTPNPVYILQQNVLAWADAQVVCVPCQTSLIPAAKSLPKSLAGLTARQRASVLATVDTIGNEIESLERSRKIPQPKALPLIHEAQLVVAALQPNN